MEIFRWGKENVTAQCPESFQGGSVLSATSIQGLGRTSGKVQSKKATFSSVAAARFADGKPNQRSLKIRTYWDDVDPTRRYWRAPDGTLDILEMNKAGRESIPT